MLVLITISGIVHGPRPLNRFFPLLHLFVDLEHTKNNPKQGTDRQNNSHNYDKNFLARGHVVLAFPNIGPVKMTAPTARVHTVYRVGEVVLWLVVLADLDEGVTFAVVVGGVAGADRRHAGEEGEGLGAFPVADLAAAELGLEAGLGARGL